MEGTLAVRALQLNAYSAVIDALRASANPNHQMIIHLISQLRQVFKISEVRHSAEVRRACGDKRLGELCSSSSSASAWLRKCRRPIPVQTEPIGVRSRKRQQIADQLIQSMTTAKSESGSFNISLEDEALKETIETKPEPRRPSSEHKQETVIKLPRGTVIQISEDVKPEAITKPGRKRKGELVIKEVVPVEPPKRTRPARSKVIPKRFHQSPDKKVVKIAVGYARRRSCVAQKLKKLEAIKVKKEDSVIKIEAELDQNKNKTNKLTKPFISNPTPPQLTLPAVPNQTAGATISNGSVINTGIGSSRRTSNTDVPLLKQLPNNTLLISQIPATVQPVHIVPTNSKQSLSFGMADILNKSAAEATQLPKTKKRTEAATIDVTPPANHSRISTPSTPGGSSGRPDYSLSATRAKTPPTPSTLRNSSQKDSPRAGNHLNSYRTSQEMRKTQELQQQILQQPSTFLTGVTPNSSLDRMSKQPPQPTRPQSALPMTTIRTSQQSKPGYSIQPSIVQRTTVHKAPLAHSKPSHLLPGRGQTVTTMSSQVRGYPSTHAQLLPNGLVPGGHHLVPVETLSRGGSVLSNHMLPSGSITLQGNHLQSHSRMNQAPQQLFLHHGYTQPLTLHNPTISNGQPTMLHLNGAQAAYSNIELTRLQQQTNNNR